jgi:two-component system nitrogen regulation response regulator NtrX
MSRCDVLIVDDDPAIVSLLETVCSRSGLLTKTAVDGDEALAVLASQRVGVILLDLWLPRVQGAEVVGALATSHPELLSRVIVFTAASETVIAEVPHADRIWGVLRKPNDIEDVMHHVFDCLLQERTRTEPTASRAHRGPDGAKQLRAG